MTEEFVKKASEDIKFARRVLELEAQSVLHPLATCRRYVFSCDSHHPSEVCRRDCHHRNLIGLAYPCNSEHTLCQHVWYHRYLHSSLGCCRMPHSIHLEYRTAQGSPLDPMDPPAKSVDYWRNGIDCIGHLDTPSDPASAP